MAGLAERLRSEGMQHEARNMLHKLMALKFGELPEWVDHKTQNASTAQLEEWMEQLLTAGTLKELLGKDG